MNVLLVLDLRKGSEIMKLICNCGNEEEFLPPEDVAERFHVDDSQHCDKKHKSFYINSGHDEVFIYCRKCGTSIHIYA
jgi:hypothetical protein